MSKVQSVEVFHNFSEAGGMGLTHRLLLLGSSLKCSAKIVLWSVSGSVLRLDMPRDNGGRVTVKVELLPEGQVEVLRKYGRLKYEDGLSKVAHFSKSKKDVIDMLKPFEARSIITSLRKALVRVSDVESITDAEDSGTDGDLNVSRVVVETSKSRTRFVETVEFPNKSVAEVRVTAIAGPQKTIEYEVMIDIGVKPLIAKALAEIESDSFDVMEGRVEME